MLMHSCGECVVMLNKAKAKRKIKGDKISRRGFSINYLLYAYDLIRFFKVTLDSYNYISWILFEFGNIFGFQVQKEGSFRKIMTRQLKVKLVHILVK